MGAWAGAVRPWSPNRAVPAGDESYLLAALALVPTTSTRLYGASSIRTVTLAVPLRSVRAQAAEVVHISCLSRHTSRARSLLRRSPTNRPSRAGPEELWGMFLASAARSRQAGRRSAPWSPLSEEAGARHRLSAVQNRRPRGRISGITSTCGSDQRRGGAAAGPAARWGAVFGVRLEPLESPDLHGPWVPWRPDVRHLALRRSSGHPLPMGIEARRVSYRRFETGWRLCERRRFFIQWANAALRAASRRGGRRRPGRRRARRFFAGAGGDQVASGADVTSSGDKV